MRKLLQHFQDFSKLHILLFAIFPVLSLYTANIGNLYFKETYRSFFFAISLSLLIFSFGRLIFGTWEQAALFTSPLLLLFFAYGHIYNGVEHWEISGVPIGRHRYLMAISLSLLVGWGWLLKFKIRDFKRVNFVLFAISLVMITMPLTEWFQSAISEAGTKSSNDEQTITLAWEGENNDLPDIYYIILDGYARSDTLASLYDFDNSDFIDGLRQRGFYIADQSYSNYIQTLLSLSSSLNLNYTTDLIQNIDYESEDRSILEDLVQHSLVRDYLDQLGYVMVAFSTPLPGSTIDDADIFWETNTNQLLIGFNSFEGKLAEASIFRLILDSQVLLTKSVGEQLLEPGYEAHRNQILNTFNRLPDPASLEGHHFVFAHIVAPHPPFIFGPNGERLAHDTTFSFLDGSHFEGSQEEYINRYRDQVIYISELVLEAIDEIQTSSEIPPIIILQADHGPGAYLHWGIIEETNLSERFAILNAIYLPGGDQGVLYPQISPINTFRVILNRYFSSELPLLPDRSFYSGWETPYDVLEVTTQLP